VVGGALLEHFWWGSVFLINVPIILAGLALVAILVPESRNPNPGRVDVPGVLLSILGLILLVYGIIDGGEHGFDQPLVWVSIVAGLAVLAAFLRYERRSDHPSLDVSLFADRRFSAAVATTGLVFFAALGAMFFMAFYLQLVRGYTPLQTGLLMTPFAIAQLVFAPQSAGMVRRFGPKRVCATGMALVTVTLLGFSFVGASTPIWILLVLTFIQGAGMANVMPPITESIMSSLPPAKAGVGSAVSNTVRQVGAALGVAILGAMLSAVYHDQIGGAVAGLPEPAKSVAGESLAGAYGVAAQLGPAGGPLVHSANDAFVSAMHWAAGGAAMIGLLGVLVTLAWLPRRADPHHAPAPARSGDLAMELAD
jgi:predicted MFS family arabinose efflux permease